MPPLGEVLNTIVEADDGYRIDAREGWTTGRSVYGGMTAALCAQAVALRYPGLPPLRSAQFTFIGPAAGTLQLRPEMLREGRSSVVAGVDYRADGTLAARATFTYGADRESAVVHDLVPVPEVPAPDACEPFFGTGPGPGFAQYFEHRFAGGSRPRSVGQVPTMLAWMRLVDTDGADPLMSLIALADALPPAALVAFPAAAPISTMTWTLDIFEPARMTGWTLVRTASEQAASGYSLQAMDAWNEDGVRLACGRQVVALFA